ncbi:MAG: hypothetical protein DCF25_00775 [Leptolyngbya foveolarum]|uniref:DUF2283 domain-containing protein n=1 Tax=Leptolyngbya foveolarum TaxID=47253 RepID=A0A2W4UQR0_9CYAN|nr:MAG: hypothetical protein DCF25_00775 [Leptolyngbya foveolarum]
MKSIYDPDKDILHISLTKAVVEETTQIAPGLILDYDEDGKVIGLEIRKASQKVDDPYEMTHLVGKGNENKPPAKGIL